MSPKNESEQREQVQKFYARIGYYISRWAYIERELFEICNWALNTNNDLAVFTFYDKNSLNSKFDYTNGLLQRTAQKSIFDKWKNLLGRLRQLATIRNFVAHQPIQLGSRIKIAINTQTMETVRVEIGENDWKVSTDENLVKSGKYRYKEINNEDLKTYIDEIEIIYKELVLFKEETCVIKNV